MIGNWCQAHWDELRAEVDRQGLSALVSDNGEKAAASVARQVTDGVTADSFDPLLGAWMAMGQFMLSYSATLLVYSGCPICRGDELHQAQCQEERHPKPCTTSFANFFQNAVTDQVECWKTLRVTE